MKSTLLLFPLAAAMALTLPAQDAAAQYNDPPPPPYPAQQASATYGYANVLRVTPVYNSYTTSEQRCDGPPQQASNNVAGGTVLGAIVGGVIGNAIGRGSNSGTRAGATAAGAIAGGAIGNNIARNSDPGYAPGCRMVQVRHDDGPPMGFDVEYDYKGDVYTARMPYDPGNRVRVRVSVIPAEGPARYRR